MGQIAEFLVYQIDFLQFLLGTSFFFIALISYVLYDEQGKCEGTPWLWFSLFSATVAFCRIMGVFLSPLFAYGQIPFPKLVFLVVSNIFLFRFVYSCAAADKRSPYFKLVLVVVTGILLLALFGHINYSYVFAYVFMFLPLSLFAGRSFVLQSQRAGSRLESVYFKAAGYLIAILGVFLPFPVGMDIAGVVLLLAGVIVSGVFCFCLWRVLDLQKKAPLFGSAISDRNAGIYMFLSVISLLLFGFLMVNYSGNYAYNVIMKESGIHLSDVVRSLKHRIEKSDSMTRTLSGSPYILPALLNRTTVNLKNAYSVLDRYRRSMNASVCYLMDRDGLVIAASNEDDSLSFVGRDYSFRTYFSDAIQGRQGRLFAKGITTGIKGYYSSYPVFDGKGAVMGAVVVKQDLSPTDLPGEQMIYLKIKGEKEIFLKSATAERNFGRGIIGRDIANLPDRSFILGGRRFIKISSEISSTGAEGGLLSPLDLVVYFRMFAIAITFLLVFVAGLGNHFIRKQRYHNLILKDKNDELQKKSEELEGFFGVNLDLLCIADLDGNFVKVNKEWENILGYSVKALEKKKFLEFVHPDDMNATLDAMSKLGKNEQVLEFVNRYRAKDGSYRYIEWRSHPYGKLIYAAARDITERKRIEGELLAARDRAHRQRLAVSEMIINNAVFSPDIYVSMDKITEIISSAIGVSRVSIWLASDDNSELQCLSLYESGKKAHNRGEVLRASVFPRYFAALESERTISAERARTDPRTSEFTVPYLVPLGISSMLDAGIVISGRLAGVVCLEHVGSERKWHSDEESFASTTASLVAQIIAEMNRRSAEKKLIESQARFDNMIRNVPGIVYRCVNDADWTMEFISDEVFRITGYPVSDFIKNSVRSFSSVIHPDDAKKVRTTIEDSISKHSVYEIEYRLVTVSGNTKWVREQGGGVFDENGTLLWLDGVIVDIETLKRYQDALKASEQWFEKSLMSIGDGLISCDEEGRVALMNPVAEKLTGWKKHEAVNKPIWEVMHIVNENTGDPVENPAYRALREGKQVELANHTVLVSRSGGRVYIDDSAAPIKDANGRILGAILVFRDISAKKESEKRIRQLSRAVENSSASIVITDMNGNIEYVNPKFSELTGYSFSEASGQNPRILKSGRQPAEFYKKLWDTILSGDTWKGELLNKKKNGEFYWEYASISPIRDDDGKTMNFVAVKEDITSIKQVQLALMLAKDQLESTLNAVPDLMFEVRSDGEVVSLHTSDPKQLVAPPEELIGRNISDFLPPGPTEVCMSALAEAGRSGRSLGKQYSLQLPQGEAWFELSVAKKLGDAEGEAHFIVLVRNVSDRKKAEQELIKKNQELEQLYKIKSDFTSMVSHELRTPLTSIKEGIGIVLDGSAGVLNDEQKDFLEIAKRNVDRLHRLINDVLDFSKLESKKVTFNIKVGDLTRLVKDISDSYRPVCESKGLYLKFVSGKSDNLALFDEDRISQVLNNLLSNAIKFTVAGGITMEILSEKNKGSIVVRISDTGPGIKPEDTARLFERYVQLGGPSDRKTGGTGLGLAISREIIDAHHGRIWVESEYGKGSSFCFSVPSHREG